MRIPMVFSNVVRVALSLLSRPHLKEMQRGECEQGSKVVHKTWENMQIIKLFHTILLN
jgi:hypothetical protein